MALSVSLSIESAVKPMQRISWQDLIIPGGIIASILVMLVPLPTWLLDVFLTANITFAVIILLTTLNIRKSLELSVFPAILLTATLGRLVLNVASTRLILTGASSNGSAAAGNVIQSFGAFVAGNDIMVGLVIFAILVVIQFVVLTKGATRVSEVAARFTLDGMPGRQMAIDSDLNAGLISQQEAYHQRQELMAQSNFYGAMDGASKFVRGDAIAAIIITGINIIVGLIYGVFKAGMPLTEAAEVFTFLTIGDGLVSQVPALLIALATAILVTRTSQTEKLSHQLLGQLFSHPQVLVVAAVFLGILTLTSLPKVPMLLMAVGCVGLAYVITGKQAAKSDDHPPSTSEPQGENQISQLLKVEPLLLGLGVRLLPLAQRSGTDGILHRIHQLRQELAGELGLVLPEIRIRDNLELAGNQYEICIHGDPVARGRLSMNRWLVVANNQDLLDDRLSGVQLEDASDTSHARWINSADRPQAVELGYQPLNAADVLSIHLNNTVRSHAADLLTHDAVTQLIAQLHEQTPAIVDEVVPHLVSLGQLQQILQLLLSQGVSIRSLPAILEAIARHAPLESHPVKLTEHVRQRLSRTICRTFSEQERVSAITLCEKTEQWIAQSMHYSERELKIDLEPVFASQLCHQINQAVIRDQKAVAVIVDRRIRPAVQQLTDHQALRVPVLALEEIPPAIQIISDQNLTVPVPAAFQDSDYRQLV